MPARSSYGTMPQSIAGTNAITVPSLTLTPLAVLPCVLPATPIKCVCTTLDALATLSTATGAHTIKCVWLIDPALQALACVLSLTVI